MARRKTRKLAKGQGRWHYLLYWVKSKDRVSLQDHLVRQRGPRAFGLRLSPYPLWPKALHYLLTLSPEPHLHHHS
jgi:hypothetical protein